MQFTEGRDLKLTPAQDGPPLNYFVYPYVEVAGKEHANVSIAFSFEVTGKPANVAAMPALPRHLGNSTER